MTPQNEHRIGLIVNPNAGTAVKSGELAEMLAGDGKLIDVFESGIQSLPRSTRSSQAPERSLRQAEMARLVALHPSSQAPTWR